MNAGGFRAYRCGNLANLRFLIGLDQDLSPKNITKDVEIGVDKPAGLYTNPTYSCLH